ncbi:MAG: MnhB domain-containing protein, partial [Gammaproteobacteria bacterium]
ASGIILYALLEGEARALTIISHRVLVGLMCGGALLYAGVGLAGMLLGGNFLDYSVLSADPVKGQQYGIILIEAGVGVTVTGVLLCIFHAFAAREQ